MQTDKCKRNTAVYNLPLEKPREPVMRQADTVASSNGTKLDTVLLLWYPSQKCRTRIRHKETDKPTSKDMLQNKWPGLLKNAKVPKD